MKTNKLIDSLCEDLEPVKPLAHPMARAWPWALLAVGYTIVAVLIRGIRPDLMPDKLEDVTFIFEMVLAFLIMISALLTSFWTSVPDMRGQKWLVSLPVTLTLVFIIWTMCRIIGEGADLYTHKFSLHDCMGDAILFTTLPIIGLLALSAKRHATCSITCTTLNVLCASAMGFMALRVTCTDDTIEQALLYHLAPFIALGIVIGIISRRFHNW